jgi:hypothetical protein
LAAATDLPQLLALPFVRAGEVLQRRAGFAPRETGQDKTERVVIVLASQVFELLVGESAIDGCALYFSRATFRPLASAAALSPCTC